eukprot:7194688-Lingulodinium_polyedra.AAC.1
MSGWPTSAGSLQSRNAPPTLRNKHPKRGRLSRCAESSPGQRKMRLRGNRRWRGAHSTPRGAT